MPLQAECVPLRQGVKKIVLTGGGTAGHVMPHVALLPEMRRCAWEIYYIGSKGIEKEIMVRQGVAFYEIPVGKLRRYLSWQNLWDVFKVVAGTVLSFYHLLRLKPDVVFSKGGFVSVPVALAAWCLRIPVVTHESDRTPGLATRIILPFACQLLYAFPESATFFPLERAQLTGIPIRQQLFNGDAQRGLARCGFTVDDSRPVLLVMGGSLGAQRINELVYDSLPELLSRFRVIHLAGKGKLQTVADPAYCGFEYVDAGLEDLFAATQLVVARAGANSIFEFLALNKPMLLIPLEIGSRGDQHENAESFVAQGWAEMVSEKELTAAKLIAAIDASFQKCDEMSKSQSLFQANKAAEKIMEVLEYT